MQRLTLQMAVDDLYDKARVKGVTTSTKRLETLADFCLQELARRRLAAAVKEPSLPGFARSKHWDVAWFHHKKPRLAISLKSLLTNLSGTVPNRIDDLLGEVANVQMYSPEIVIGYIMLFNVEKDCHSKKHGCSWGELLDRRIASISGRRAPHWTVGTIEAAAVVGVDFSSGPVLLAGARAVEGMFDTLVQQVFDRNPDLDH